VSPGRPLSLPPDREVIIMTQAVITCLGRYAMSPYQYQYPYICIRIKMEQVENR